MQRASHHSDRHAAVRAALERARADGLEQTVVFHLRGHQTPTPPTAAQTERLAAGLVEKVASQCGHPPKQKTVFENLGAVAVHADADWLLTLLDQPEVQTASLNRPPAGSIEPIRPVRKSAPSRKGWVDLPD